METTSDNVVAVTDRPFRFKRELMGLERSAAAGICGGVLQREALISAVLWTDTRGFKPPAV